MTPFTCLGRTVFQFIVLLCFLYLLLPIVIVIMASFTSSTYLSFPPPGFSWQWFERSLEMEWFRRSLVFSLSLALVATLIASALGILAARVLSRHQFRGKEVLEYIFLSPLIIPAVVLGFALLTLFVDWGWRNPHSNLLAGHVVITLPYIIRSVWASMAGMDRSLEEAAQSLGANPLVTFWRVTLPLVRPGIIAGFILAFTYSFNDVTVSIFLTGPNASTLPVEMMSYLSYSADPTPAAISTITIGLTLLFFLVAERFVGLGIFVER